MSEQARVPQANSATPGFLWKLAGPIRVYVRHCPFQRGKGLLVRRLLLPTLPPDPALFVARLPGGGLIRLHPRETIGFATLLDGGFETSEITCAIERSPAGTTTFDVGANVGIFSVALGRAVGPDGHVVAVEPDPANVRRLLDNLAFNSIGNARVVEAAASDREEIVELHLADDPAYNSVVAIEGRHAQTGTAAVQSVRLDQIWDDLGRPTVSFVKIDVEGGEVSVLRGSKVMIAATRPALLVEANDVRRLTLLRSELEPHGYRDDPQPGFQPWNHLFVPSDGL
jgi:FkbM family methyltransferase